MYFPVLDINDDGIGVLRIVPQRDSLPSVLGLELGEMVYQLRAALDGAVYAAAVRETGRNPPPDEEGLAFPVCHSRNRFDQSKRQIRPLTGKRRALVEALQPYNVPRELKPEQIVYNLNRTLTMLNDWARKDRHRRLHVVGAWASGASPLFRIPPPARLRDLTLAPDQFLESDCDVASFRIDGFTPEMKGKVQANPNMSIDLAVAEAPLPCAANDALDNRITAMMVLVRTVVRSMEESFPGGKSLSRENLE
jgi:hypothetical protein